MTEGATSVPEPTAESFSLQDRSASELEQRRGELVSVMTTKYRGYDDPELPVSILHELLVITTMLRRRTSGPPKAKEPKTKAPSKRASMDDLANLLGQG